MPSPAGCSPAGCDVVHVGVIPTPSLQVYVAATQARGGLAITASHNPAEYNAVKLFNSLGLFFNTYERSELLDLYHQRSFVESTNAEIREVVTERARRDALSSRSRAYADRSRRACARGGFGSRWTP